MKTIMADTKNGGTLCNITIYIYIYIYIFHGI